MNAQIKGALFTAAIALAVVYAYHKGMVPGLKDSKAVIAGG